LCSSQLLDYFCKAINLSNLLNSSRFSLDSFIRLVLCNNEILMPSNWITSCKNNRFFCLYHSFLICVFICRQHDEMLLILLCNYYWHKQTNTPFTIIIPYFFCWLVSCDFLEFPISHEKISWESHECSKRFMSSHGR